MITPPIEQLAEVLRLVDARAIPVPDHLADAAAYAVTNGLIDLHARALTDKGRRALAIVSGPTAQHKPTGLDALVGQAIEVLTSIARQTRVRGAGTPAAATEPVDFADLTAHVLTSVAANLGSVSTLLAGRPGSWEAELVRRLVDGTAGYDGDLVRWRTDPVRLPFSAEDTFFDFGIGDLFDQDRDQAVEHTYDDALTEDLAPAIERLWEQDLAAYAEAYRATAQRYLTTLGATCGVEIVAAPSPHPDPLGWDGLAEQVHEHAREHTPLPMTGLAPDWSEGTPADALRRAGHGYTARAEGKEER